MKQILSIALISFGLLSCGGDNSSEMQVGQYTTIEVEEVYDAGTVAKGEIVQLPISDCRHQTSL